MKPLWLSNVHQIPKSPQWRLSSLPPAPRRMIRFPKYGGRQAADILFTSVFTEVASLEGLSLRLAPTTYEILCGRRTIYVSLHNRYPSMVCFIHTFPGVSILYSHGYTRVMRHNHHCLGVNVVPHVPPQQSM